MRLVTVNGSVSIAKLLIDKGANVNFKDKSGKIVLMVRSLVLTTWNQPQYTTT